MSPPHRDAVPVPAARGMSLPRPRALAGDPGREAEAAEIEDEDAQPLAAEEKAVRQPAAEVDTVFVSEHDPEVASIIPGLLEQVDIGLLLRSPSEREAPANWLFFGFCARHIGTAY